MKTEKISLVIALIFLLDFSTAQQVSYNTKQVLCLVCKATMLEMEAEIAKVDPKKMIEVSGFRMTADGESSTKKVQYSKSETYLTDLMETVCDKMDDYARARYKSNGKLTIIKFMIDGGMNPDMSKVDFIQDEDLNKSLKHLCLEVLEDREEAVLKLFMEPGTPKDSDLKLCSESANYCNETIGDDYNYMELDEENENDDVGHSEL